MTTQEEKFAQLKKRQEKVLETLNQLNASVDRLSSAFGSLGISEEASACNGSGSSPFGHKRVHSETLQEVPKKSKKGAEDSRWSKIKVKQEGILSDLEELRNRLLALGYQPPIDRSQSDFLKATDVLAREGALLMPVQETYSYRRSTPTSSTPKATSPTSVSTTNGADDNLLSSKLAKALQEQAKELVFSRQEQFAQLEKKWKDHMTLIYAAIVSSAGENAFNELKKQWKNYFNEEEKVNKNTKDWVSMSGSSWDQEMLVTIFKQHPGWIECKDVMPSETAEELKEWTEQIQPRVVEHIKRTIKMVAKSVQPSLNKGISGEETGLDMIAKDGRHLEVIARSLIDAVVFPLCDVLDLSVAMEMTFRKITLPLNRLDYALLKENGDVVSVVEAKRPGANLFEAFAQAAMQLASIQEKQGAKDSNSAVLSILTDGYRYYLFKLQGSKFTVNTILWKLKTWSDVEQTTKELWRALRYFKGV